jgi:cysteine desulfuration protein SufE
MNTVLPDKLQAMLDELIQAEDLTEKYEVLIELGRQVQDIPAEKKLPECQVQGCQSLVHVYSTLEDGRVQFHGFADAMIVNGLLALLVNGLSGLTPDEFLAVDPKFIEKTGVIKTLTPSRVNGFYNIHQRMRLEAIKWKAGYGNGN